MKLLEIIDTKIDYSSEKAFPINSPVIGTGFYSDVFNKDDWSVEKVSKFPDHNEDPVDPYTFYIKYLVDHHISESNPFFPRVYSIQKNSHSSEDNSQYSFQIEKLLNLDNLNIQSLKSAASMIGLYLDAEHDYTGAFVKEIVENIRSYTEGIAKPPLYNEKFLEAISTLKKIFKQYKTFHKSEMGWDINKNNIMVRLGKTGAQLVFTDPFSMELTF